VGSRTDLVLRDRQIILGRQYKAPRLQPDCRRSVRRARAPMATDLSVSDGSAGRPGRPMDRRGQRSIAILRRLDQGWRPPRVCAGGRQGDRSL